MGLGMPGQLAMLLAEFLATGGGGGTPGGSSLQLQYNNAGSFGGVSGSSWNGTDSLTLGSGTVTVGSTTYIPHTATTGPKLLVDWPSDVNGNGFPTAFQMVCNGADAWGQTLYSIGSNNFGADYGFFKTNASQPDQHTTALTTSAEVWGIYVNGSNGPGNNYSRMAQMQFFVGDQPNAGGNVPCYFGLRLRNGDPGTLPEVLHISSAGAVSVAQIWKDAAVTFTGYKQDVTNTSSNAASLLMDLQVGSVSKFSVDLSGNVRAPNVIDLVETILFVIDGGGSAITTGIKGDIEVPFACTITRATLLADQTGSIVVNIWKDTYANYPPTVADKITASAPPTISSAINSQDSTLTGWTTSIAAGDTLRFNVDSAATISGNGPSYVQAKSRSGTIGGHAAVQAEDILGQYPFLGSDGTNWVGSLNIIGIVDGAVSAGAIPGRYARATSARLSSAACRAS